jgi:predicted dehydrogenase
MSRPLRVGVVGCGGIAQMMHLPTLAERPDLFQIAALADLSDKTLAAVGDRYGVAARFKDGRELAARPDVEAVLLFASGCHREVVLDLLRARKPIFVEKPLAFSLPETEEVARAVRDAGVPFMVGYHKRFDPAYLRARRAVREMRDLRFLEVTVLHPDDDAYRTHHAVLPVPDRPWQPQPEAEGRAVIVERVRGGAFTGCVDRIVGAPAPLHHRVGAYILFDSLIHDVDAVRGILGDPEGVVSSHVWRAGFAQTSVSRFPGDVRASLSWISVPGLKHYEETLHFVGDDTRVKLVFPSPYMRHAPTPLTIERMDGEELVVEHHTVSYEEAFRAELHHFRDALLSGRPPAPSLKDALGDARWIHQIAAAYADGASR